MSFLDKFLNVMRLNPDDDDDFYNEDYDYDDEEEEVKPKSSFKKREKEVDIFLQAPVDSNLAGICSAVSGIDHHHRCLFYVGVTAPRHTNTPIFHRHDHHGEQAYAENRLYHFLLHALFPRKSALHNTLFHGEPVYVRIFLSPFNPTQVLDSGFRSYRHHQLNPHIPLSVFKSFHILSCIDTSICHLYNRVRQHERSGF